MPPDNELQKRTLCHLLLNHPAFLHDTVLPCHAYLFNVRLPSSCGDASCPIPPSCTEALGAVMQHFRSLVAMCAGPASEQASLEADCAKCKFNQAFLQTRPLHARMRVAAAAQPDVPHHHLAEVVALMQESAADGDGGKSCCSAFAESHILEQLCALRLQISGRLPHVQLAE